MTLLQCLADFALRIVLVAGCISTALLLLLAWLSEREMKFRDQRLEKERQDGTEDDGIAPI
jgi:hypothetical protein